MNTLKKLISSRLNGDLSKKIGALKVGKQLFNVPVHDMDAGLAAILKQNLEAQLEFYRYAYFLTGKLVRKYKLCKLPEDDLYASIVEKYYSPDTKCLALGFLKLFPLEKYSERMTFFFEFGDMVLPYMTSRSDVLELFYNEGPYELGSVHLEKGDVVIDCGANLGLFSAAASSKGCKVYAFEPMPTIREKYLSATVSMNEGDIAICPYALSDKVGKVLFNEGIENMGSSCMSNAGNVEVEAITLDAFVEKNKLTSVDFIKADIEGAERLLLKGARNTIRKFKPKLSICKYHLEDDPAILTALILEADPNYIIEEHYQKIYAYVPKAEML